LKRLALGLTLGVLPVFGGGWPAQPTAITLYTAFQQEPPAAVMDAIWRELAAIMSPAGLQFDWRPLSEGGGQVTPQLAVIRFKGQCDAEGIRPKWGFPGALGWTHISNGEILPFIDINCEGVRLLLLGSLMAIPKPSRDPALGRAIGRVLAHELYHFLGNTKKHANSGIAKAVFNAEDLLAGKLRFGEKEYAALSHCRGTLLAHAAGPIESGQ
jgi:hypothetical protein